jgi:anti-sigma factor RsiW
MGHIHLASVSHAATWQLANALLESSFAEAEQQAVRQIHTLALCVEAAVQAAAAVRTRVTAELGRKLLQAALLPQVAPLCGRLLGDCACSCVEVCDHVLMLNAGGSGVVRPCASHCHAGNGFSDR